MCEIERRHEHDSRWERAVSISIQSHPPASSASSEASPLVPEDDTRGHALLFRVFFFSPFVPRLYFGATVAASALLQRSPKRLPGGGATGPWSRFVIGQRRHRCPPRDPPRTPLGPAFSPLPSRRAASRPALQRPLAASKSRAARRCLDDPRRRYRQVFPKGRRAARGGALSQRRVGCVGGWGGTVRGAKKPTGRMRRYL